MRTVIGFMEANLHRRLTVGELADVAHLAPPRLRQIFRTEMGKSPVPYLMELRMRRAKELLETTLHSVKEIAAQVGISDVSHFVRKFGQTWGLTPARHRASYHRRDRRKFPVRGDDHRNG